MLLPIVTVPEVGFASKPAPQGRFSSAPVVGGVGGRGSSKLNSFADSNSDFVDMLTMLTVLIMFTKLVMLSKSFLIFFSFSFFQDGISYPFNSYFILSYLRSDMK